MPFALNAEDGIQIHYEKAGAGTSAVLMHHGFSRTIREWKPEYSDVLAEDFTVVVMDARGHGQSDKPHDPAEYAMRKRVRDVTSVLDAVGADRAHYLGYSMGGQVGFGVARYAPERLLSLTIGGMHPYPAAVPGSQGARNDLADRARSLANGIAAHIARIEESTGPLPEPYRTEFLANDGQALAAVISSERDTHLAEDIAGFTLLTLIYTGDADGFFDGARRAADAMPNATFVALEGLDHLQAVLRADLALPHIRRFLLGVEGSRTAA